jgi:hypothetical protein
VAASDAADQPIKGKAYRITFPVFDADGDLVTTGTGLTTAAEVSKDGGTFAACTNDPAEIATTSGFYYLDLTSTEMTADTVAVKVILGNAGSKPTALVLYPLDLSEPAAVPGYGTSKYGAVISWLLALNRNKMTQTDTTTTLRNDADSASIATSTVSDSGGTFTRGEFA